MNGQRGEERHGYHTKNDKLRGKTKIKKRLKEQKTNRF